VKDYYKENILEGDEVFPMEDFEGLNSNVSYKVLSFSEENKSGYGMIEVVNELGVRRAYNSAAFVINPAGRMFRDEVTSDQSPEKSEQSDRSDS
jgi:hypothetical protein